MLLKTGLREGGDSEESSNSCDISGVTSSTEGSAVGSFTYGARGCRKHKGWSASKIQMYDTVTILLGQ